MEKLKTVIILSLIAFIGLWSVCSRWQRIALITIVLLLLTISAFGQQRLYVGLGATKTWFSDYQPEVGPMLSAELELEKVFIRFDMQEFNPIRVMVGGQPTAGRKLAFGVAGGLTTTSFSLIDSGFDFMVRAASNPTDDLLLTMFSNMGISMRGYIYGQIGVTLQYKVFDR